MSYNTTSLAIPDASCKQRRLRRRLVFVRWKASCADACLESSEQTTVRDAPELENGAENVDCLKPPGGDTGAIVFVFVCYSRKGIGCDVRFEQTRGNVCGFSSYMNEKETKVAVVMNPRTASDIPQKDRPAWQFCNKQTLVRHACLR